MCSNAPTMAEKGSAYLRSIGRRWYALVLACCGAIAALLPSSPLLMPFTYRDSGVFLYIGWRILHGEVPYRDIWDHKPPVILYLNALGVALGNGSRWGIWLLELVMLTLAAYIGLRLLTHAFGGAVALLSPVLWLLTLGFVIEGGNLTTEYTLVLQFAALALVYHMGRAELPWWRWLLIGLLGGMAFFTKQTAIGIWVAIVIYVCLVRFRSGEHRRLAGNLAALGTGGVIVAAGWVAVFALQGALVPFWEAAFYYNFAYTTTTDISTRLLGLLVGHAPLARAGLLQLALIGYGMALLLVRYRRDLVSAQLPLFGIMLINLPLEFGLIHLSGRAYPHYFMTLLPALALCAALPLQVLLQALSAWRIPWRMQSVMVAIVAIALGGAAVTEYGKQVAANRRAGNPAAVAYLQAQTTPGEAVVLWGAEASINYLAQRPAVGRYIYQLPLYTNGYTSEARITAFLDDLLRYCPHLIIDTRNANTPMLIFPIDTAAIRARTALVHRFYRPVALIDDWVVYRAACRPGVSPYS